MGRPWKCLLGRSTVKALLRRLLLLAFGLVALASGCGGGASDSENARCTTPNAVFGDATDVGGHREATVHFTCEGAELAGTLYLPTEKRKHPAVVWVHGSGETPRLNYGTVVAPLVETGSRSSPTTSGASVSRTASAAPTPTTCSPRTRTEQWPRSALTPKSILNGSGFTERARRAGSCPCECPTKRACRLYRPR